MSKGIEWDRLRRLIQDVAESQGYELVDVEFKGSGNSSVLRVYIDKPAGISHRDCELVSEQVGTVLDVEDLIPLNQQKVFRGRLQGLHDGKVRLELRNGDELDIPLDVIQEARLEIDWAAELSRQNGSSRSDKREQE